MYFQPFFFFLPQFSQFHHHEIPIPLTSRIQLHEQYGCIYFLLQISWDPDASFSVNFFGQSREYLLIDLVKNEASLDKEAEDRSVGSRYR